MSGNRSLLHVTNQSKYLLFGINSKLKPFTYKSIGLRLTKKLIKNNGCVSPI